jgi:hypothetical protein
MELDRKEQDGETNKKKIKMFEVRTLEERARASFLEGRLRGLCNSPSQVPQRKFAGTLLRGKLPVEREVAPA